MWKCPNCDALNTGTRCAVCKEDGPLIDPAAIEASDESTETDGYIYINDKTEEEKLIEKKRKTRIPIVTTTAILVICTISFLTWAVMESKYTSAIAQLNNHEYELAISNFSDIFFYKDSKDLVNETLYRQAVYFLESNHLDDARLKFEMILDYKDASDLYLETKYKKAETLEKYGDAYLANKLYAETKGYKDSDDRREQTKDTIYNKGITLYRSKQMAEAKKHFELVIDHMHAKDYITLIDSVNGIDVMNTKTLIPLIGFENAAEVLLMDQYFKDYIIGRWMNANRIFIEYIADVSGGLISNYNLPNDLGRYYTVKDGIHYVGDNDNDMKPQFKFTIESANQIKVYCYKNQQNYTLTRQSSGASGVVGISQE